MGFIHVVLAATMAASLMPQRARAALGEPEATIAAETRQFRGSIKATQFANYRVHEIALPSGTILREFAAPAGTVFAIAWRGPVLPDLRQALGQYFDVYVTAAQARRGGSHHHFEVRQDAFVMQSSGHMRAFSGRAYLPTALPAGVSLDELH
jgi:hypothetical protein